MTPMEYHVGMGCFEIYAGRLNKKRDKWIDKSNVTDEAINSVRDYMVNQFIGNLENVKNSSGGYEWTLKNGDKIELRIFYKQQG